MHPPLIKSLIMTCVTLYQCRGSLATKRLRHNQPLLTLLARDGVLRFIAVVGTYEGSKAAARNPRSPALLFSYDLELVGNLGTGQGGSRPASTWVRFEMLVGAISLINFCHHTDL